MSDYCLFPLCKRIAQSDGYCINHHMYSGVNIEKPKPKLIPKKSASMKLQDKDYKKFVAEFLARPENKFCAIQINENCTRIATTVNHKKRRGKENKMNEEDCEPSCSYCNVAIEGEDGWARDHEHLKSKYQH